MKIVETEFEGLLVLEPKVYSDERGFFFESYNKNSLKALGIDMNFIQDNQSFSKKGVIRGLHFQKPPFSKTKLVRTLSGKILDVVLDLRKEQPTYRKTFSIELSSDNNLQLLVPKGFAHGFSTLSSSAIILYKCDEYYAKDFEGGIRVNDPSLNIDWKIKISQQILSQRDLMLPNHFDQDFSF